MATEQVSRTVLEYAVNEQSIRKAVRSVDSVERSLTDSLDVIGDYGPVTRAAMSSVETGFEGLRRSVQADQAELNDLRRDLLALDDLVVTPEIQVAQTGSASVDTNGANGLDSLDRVSASASQIFSGLGQGGLANAAGLVGDTLSAVTAFGPAAGVAAAAGAGLTLVMGELSKGLQAAKEKADNFFGNQQTIEQLIASGGTSSDIQELIDARQLEYDATYAQIDALRELKSEVDNYTSSSGRSYTEVLQDIADATDGQVQSFPDLIARYDELDKQLQDADTDLSQYNLALYDGRVAANDAAEAAAAAAAARDHEVQVMLAAAQEVESLTAEQRKTRVDALREELESVQAAAEMDGISAEYKTELTQRTADLNTQIESLSADIYTAADATEAANKALERMNDAQDLYGDLIDESFEALQREGEIREKAADAAEEYAAAITKHEQAVTDIRAQADTKRQEDEANAAEQREKLETQHAKKIAEIVKKTNATLASAIMNRDALAYYLAQQAAKEQIDAEEDAYKERQKDIDDALKKQLDSQQRALNEALAKEEARWRDEKATRDRAIAQIQNDLANAQAAALAIQQNARVQSLVIMELRATGEARVYSDMAANADFWLTYMENRSQAAWAAIAQSMLTPGTGIGSGGTTQPTPFADGGYVTRDGLALVHAGEKIYPPINPAGRAPLNSTVYNQTAGGINIQVNGTSKAAIIKQVNQQLGDYLAAAGFR